METNNYYQKPNVQNTGSSQFSINIILKICGALAVVCLMFLPVAGCKNYNQYNVNGCDLIFKATKMDFSLVFFILSVLCGLAIIFFNKPVQFVIGSLSGIVTFLIAFFYVKSKQGMDIMELKIGAYLALLIYMAIAVVSFIRKTSVKPQSISQQFQNTQYSQQPKYPQQQQYSPPSPVPQQPQPQQQQALKPKFCTKCGNKFPENFQGQFCTSCGSKIQFPKI